jgi:RNA polymerase sigma factor (sigma-70 family)
LSEADLIKACLQNDRIAQRELYKAYAGRMLVVSNRYAQSREEGEDILQEAFVKIFKYLHTFRGESTIGAWIKRIVVNTAIKFVRARDELQFHDDMTVFANDFSDSNSSVENIHYQELLAIIQQLPAGCQAVFNLYAIEGFQHNEIAELLEISVGTSKSQYSRAKTLLQGMISSKIGSH